MRLITFLAALALAVPAFAHDYKLGGLVIDHPVAFETPKVARAGGAYVTITNTGDSDDRLIEVRTDYPMTQIHLSAVDDKGIATMTQQDGVTIPAGQTVALEPGGLHIMVMGLTPGEGFVAGQSFAAMLIFENAGEIEVEFQIESRKDGGDHSNH